MHVCVSARCDSLLFFLPAEVDYLIPKPQQSEQKGPIVCISWIWALSLVQTKHGFTDGESSNSLFFNLTAREQQQQQIRDGPTQLSSPCYLLMLESITSVREHYKY